ncbi:sugar ABC transporter permease [Spirochaetia bacterium]|nr:sugar ABC transporter permease [Spirochaetia bacterium]
MDKLQQKNYMKRYKLKKQLEWYSFIVVTLTVLVILVYIPMITTVRYSFYDVSTMGFSERFIGLGNYEFLMGNQVFIRVMGNTLLLGLMGLLTIPIGFILASLINSVLVRNLQSFFRVGFYLPNILTGITIIMIFQIILKGYNGSLNMVLSALSGRQIEIGWLSDPRFAKIGATVIWVYSGLGYSMLINLASMQAIPREIYEAAEVDGASAFKQWLFLTIPNMKACFSFLLVTGMISGLSRFNDLFILSGYSGAGGNGGALQTILLYIYQYSFEQPRYGLSSAGALILFIFVLVFTLINVKLSGMFKGESQ